MGCACHQRADCDAEDSEPADLVVYNLHTTPEDDEQSKPDTTLVTQWENSGLRPVDICGSENSKFILIQSNTDWHYIEVVSLKDSMSITNLKTLREEYRDGDHYLARFYLQSCDGSHRAKRFTNFYIIKGDSCVKVPWKCFCDKGNELSDRIFELHPDCQGGSFYCANRAGFYIIRNQDNTYLQVRHMSKDKYKPDTASRYKLHESFTNGLYYFATDNYFYVLKKHSEVGFVYHRTMDLKSTADAEMLRVSPSIASLLRCSLPNQQASKGI